MTPASISDPVLNVESDNVNNEAYTLSDLSDDEEDNEMMLEDGISDDGLKESKHVAKFEHIYSVDFRPIKRRI